MPVLKNPRHERFAQELAAGKPASISYEIAGYRPNDGNASVLKADQRVSSRVQEILTERGKIHEKAVAKAIDRLDVTIESLIKEADEIQAEARKDGQPGAAVAALTAKAKLAGLWVEKRENTNIKRDATDWTRAELVAILGDEGAGGKRAVAPNGRNGKLN